MNGDPFAREPPAFCLYLLGAFRLERRDDQAGDAPTGDAPMGRLYRLIRLPMRKVESLLAYLVLNPEKHAREKLAALLWGDVPDDRRAIHSAPPSPPSAKRSATTSCWLTAKPSNSIRASPCGLMSASSSNAPIWILVV